MLSKWLTSIEAQETCQIRAVLCESALAQQQATLVQTSACHHVHDGHDGMLKFDHDGQIDKKCVVQPRSQE